MNETTQDELVPGTATAESTPDYWIREIEARVDRRLEALEAAHARARSMARFMAIGFGATLITLAVVLRTMFGGALSPASLLTEEVVLRDVDGTTRGRLGTDADGRVQFSLSDPAGRGRIRLTVLADGSPGVTISDSDARPRAVLGYLPDGTTSLVFADAQGTSRAVVGLEPDGSTHALFSDRGGRIRALVGVGSDGVPSVSVMEGRQAAPLADDTP